MKKFSLFVICLFIAITINAQTILDGEIRPRTEYRYGYQELPSDLDFALFTTQRTRVNFQHTKEKLASRISIQDIRVWGDEQLKTDVASIGVVEAWAEWFLHDSISIKFGRQPLFYDNQRLMSNNNWKQTAQSHDAVILKIKAFGTEIHLGSAFNNDQEKKYNSKYSVNGNYKTLNYFWLSKQVNSNIKISLLSLTDGFESDSSYKIIYIRGTFGGNIELKYENVGANVRAYYQTGKYKGKEITAFYFNPELFYQTKKIGISLGSEYLSGEDNTKIKTNEIKAFSTLYGTAHSFNGYLDYFTNFAPDKHDTKGVGLIDNYLSFKYSITSKAKIETDFHYFMLPNDYHYDKKDSSKVAKPYLGSEIDITYKYNYSKNISLNIGYSAMLGTETLKYLKGGNEKKLASWAYIMLTFKPVFYSKD